MYVEKLRLKPGVKSSKISSCLVSNAKLSDILLMTYMYHLWVLLYVYMLCF